MNRLFTHRIAAVSVISVVIAYGILSIVSPADSLIIEPIEPRPVKRPRPVATQVSQAPRVQVRAPVPISAPRLDPEFREIQAPSPEALKAEVEQDPHQTPLSLIRYSEELGQHMDLAAESDAYAEKFFRYLEGCAAMDERDSALPVRAICLINARKLSETKPELLAGGFENLTNRVTEDLVLFSEDIDSEE